MAREKKRGGCLPLLVLLGGTTLLFYAVTVITPLGTSDSGSSGDSRDSGPTATYAFAISKQFIEDQLTSPSTAKHPWTATSDGVTVTDLGGGKYAVNSWVDSQNAFGAMVRTKYTCVVSSSDGTNWSCEAMEVR